MAAFRFEAVDASGRSQSGLLEADSARSARSQLRSQGLTPISVEAARNDGGRETRPWRRRLSARHRAEWTRQLAGLLLAGLPLDEALSVLTEQAETESLSQLAATIRAEVLGGQSLAGAMGQHQRDFDEVYRALVAAGEQTGRLGTVLERLADFLEERLALRQKITLAFTYPAIVSFVALAIVTLLLTYVVPQVVGVFRNTRQALPFLTVALLWLSAFVRQWGWLVALVVAIAGRTTYVILRQPGPRLAWHRRLLGLPIAGRLVRDYNTVRFVSTLAILTTATVPILRALEAAGRTLTNAAMRGAIDDAIARVAEGAPLSRALAASSLFPPTLVHLVRSGEATGEVAAMLERAARAQSRDLERRTLLLTTLLEPLLIVTMGLIVLLIVLAIMMPIIELNDLVH